jgi:hypothetical protein
MERIENDSGGFTILLSAPLDAASIGVKVVAGGLTETDWD